MISNVWSRTDIPGVWMSTDIAFTVPRPDLFVTLGVLAVLWLVGMALIAAVSR